MNQEQVDKYQKESLTFEKYWEERIKQYERMSSDPEQFSQVLNEEYKKSLIEVKNNKTDVGTLLANAWQ